MRKPDSPLATIVRPVRSGRGWPYLLTDLRTGERYHLVAWTALRQFLNARRRDLH
jgi:hypothetical protein